MGRKKKTFFGQSLIANNATFLQYFYRLAEIGISRFEWKNLPDTCDARYLELSLFTQGQAIYFRDEVIGDLCLSCIPNGTLSIYGYPISRRAFSIYNNYQLMLDENNSVIIYNNMMRMNSFLDLQIFSQRLWNIDRSIDVNVNAQKTPVLIIGDEKQKLSLLNLYKEWDGNAPVIFGYKGLDPNLFTTLKTDAPYVSGELYELKVFIWNEALTYLGIPNTNVMKRERVITDEIERAQAGAFASRESALFARKQAADEINRMFGTNIEVDFRDHGMLDLVMPNKNEDQIDMLGELS